MSVIEDPKVGLWGGEGQNFLLAHVLVFAVVLSTQTALSC